MRITKKILQEYLLRFVDEKTAKYLADNRRFFEFKPAFADEFDHDKVSGTVYINADKHNFPEGGHITTQAELFEETARELVGALPYPHEIDYDDTICYENRLCLYFRCKSDITGMLTTMANMHRATKRFLLKCPTSQQSIEIHSTLFNELYGYPEDILMDSDNTSDDDVCQTEESEEDSDEPSTADSKCGDVDLLKDSHESNMSIHHRQLQWPNDDIWADEQEIYLSVRDNSPIDAEEFIDSFTQLLREDDWMIQRIEIIRKNCFKEGEDINIGAKLKPDRKKYFMPFLKKIENQFPDVKFSVIIYWSKD